MSRWCTSFDRARWAAEAGGVIAPGRTARFKEFREFAVKGNVVDLAVGVIMGVPRGHRQSLVADIVMPPLGLLLGGVDFKDLFVVLKDPSADAAPFMVGIRPWRPPRPPAR